jgi:hypothetical protein
MKTTSAAAAREIEKCLRPADLGGEVFSIVISYAESEVEPPILSNRTSPRGGELRCLF